MYMYGSRYTELLRLLFSNCIDQVFMLYLVHFFSSLSDSILMNEDSRNVK